ncbi:MAG: hypothetical protein KBT02_09630, partial [Treponema sp.]|nr:hypothetical protein [Candidatus Treponema caballi]
MKVMKKLAIACIAVMVLLTVSCGGDSPSNSNPAGFLRTSSDGYNEIFFDNFTSEVSNTSMIAVLRKEADEEYWTYAFWIYQNYNVDHLENIPPLKDYYATNGKTYTYQIQFSDTDYSGEVQITTNKSLGDVTVTPGTVEFNQSTGKLEFSTLPVFHYTPAGSFFDECNKSIVYSYP